MSIDARTALRWSSMYALTDAVAAAGNDWSTRAFTTTGTVAWDIRVWGGRAFLTRDLYGRFAVQIVSAVYLRGDMVGLTVTMIGPHHPVEREATEQLRRLAVAIDDGLVPADLTYEDAQRLARYLRP